MNPKRIFITGATGCIGHYITQTLIQNTEHELYLLVRNPDKLRIDPNSRPGIEVLHGDMRQIDRFAPLLQTINVAVLTATAWGGGDVFDVNVLKTMRLMEWLDPEFCEQILYFSTASILDRHNEPLKEARELGTDYIRTKYDCYSRLSRLGLASRITTLFPTLVFGGEDTGNPSHLTTGLPQVLKWINLIRFLKADGSFHFIHARDIAQIVLQLIQNPPTPSQPFVLGNQSVTVNQAVAEICAYLQKKIYFRIPLSGWLTDLIINLFKIQMSVWDRFCLNYRHFTYQNAVTPASFGLNNYCNSLADILRTTFSDRTQPRNAVANPNPIESQQISRSAENPLENHQTTVDESVANESEETGSKLNEFADAELEKEDSNLNKFADTQSEPNSSHPIESSGKQNGSKHQEN